MDTSTLKTMATETIYLVAQATDELDIKLLESLFIPEKTVMVDVSGHLGLPAQEILPEVLAQQMIQVISGFTSSHHVITNPIVHLETSSKVTAKATAYKTAYHCLQEPAGEMHNATARGRWEMEMELFQDRWAIRSFTVIRTVPLLPAELDLWDRAKALGKEGKGRLVKS